MIWFTSDTHFCHNKEFVYLSRGYATVEDMNKSIVEKWNAKIQDGDIVYHLGDVIMSDIDAGMEYLKQLKGEIRIIRGNHDTDKKVAAYETLPNIQVLGWGEMIKYKKRMIFMSHFPSMTTIDDGKKGRQKIIGLYGHTHQEDPYNENPYLYNVGMDAHANEPISIDEVLERIGKKWTSRD